MDFKKNYKDIIAQFFKRKMEGADYTQIRKELREEDYEEDIIKKIVQAVDDQVLQDELERSRKKGEKIMRPAGWFFTVLGVIFIFGLLSGIPFFAENNLLAYGSLIVGLTLLFYGYLKNRKA